MESGQGLIPQDGEVVIIPLSMPSNRGGGIFAEDHHVGEQSKNLLSHLGHGIGDQNLLEGAAFAEGPFPDRGHAMGDPDLGQGSTAAKAPDPG